MNAVAKQSPHVDDVTITPLPPPSRAGDRRKAARIAMRVSNVSTPLSNKVRSMTLEDATPPTPTPPIHHGNNAVPARDSRTAENLAAQPTRILKTQSLRSIRPLEKPMQIDDVTVMRSTAPFSEGRRQSAPARATIYPIGAQFLEDTLDEEEDDNYIEEVEERVTRHYDVMNDCMI